MAIQEFCTTPLPNTVTVRTFQKVLAPRPQNSQEYRAFKKKREPQLPFCYFNIATSIEIYRPAADGAVAFNAFIAATRLTLSDVLTKTLFCMSINSWFACAYCSPAFIASNLSVSS